MNYNEYSYILSLKSGTLITAKGRDYIMNSSKHIKGAIAYRLATTQIVKTTVLTSRLLINLEFMEYLVGGKQLLNLEHLEYLRLTANVKPKYTIFYISFKMKGEDVYAGLINIYYRLTYNEVKRKALK